MKNHHLLIATIITISAAIGSSMAAVISSETSGTQALTGQVTQPQQASTQSQQSSNSTLMAQTQDESSAIAPESIVSDVPQSVVLDSASRRPLRLTDSVPPTSEFYGIREQLRQAVNDRSPQFVQSLLPPNGISIGFSANRLSAQDLDLANPNASFWGLLQKAIAPGCEQLLQSNYPDVDPNAGVWSCSNVSYEFYEQYPKPADAEGIDYETHNLIVVGEDVNVRAEPNADSSIVGVLSNEVVAFDREAWDQIPQESRPQQIDSLEGWVPVILPNQKRGYVSNRFAYSPLDYQVIFGKVDGRWQILGVPGGD